jgi:hypothetical protein
MLKKQKLKIKRNPGAIKYGYSLNRQGKNITDKLKLLPVTASHTVTEKLPPALKKK